VEAFKGKGWGEERAVEKNKAKNSNKRENNPPRGEATADKMESEQPPYTNVELLLGEFEAGEDVGGGGNTITSSRKQIRGQKPSVKSKEDKTVRSKGELKKPWHLGVNQKKKGRPDTFKETTRPCGKKNWG